MTTGLARNGFDIDLRYGEAREDALVHTFLKDKVEVKSDRYAARTGNVFVEYRYKERPSGLAVTTAHWWAFEIVGLGWTLVETRGCANGRAALRRRRYGQVPRQRQATLVPRVVRPAEVEVRPPVGADNRCDGQAAVGVAVEAKGEDFVFVSERGKMLDQSNVASRLLKPAASAAGVPWLSFHSLRHYCATELFRRGLNAKQVQLWLGHHSPAFTLERYVHLLPDDLPASPWCMDTPTERAATTTERMEIRRAAVAMAARPRSSGSVG